MLGDRPREEQVLPHGREHVTADDLHRIERIRLEVAVLDEHAAENALQIALGGLECTPLEVVEDAHAGLLDERLDGDRVVAGSEQHLDELLCQPLAERCADRLRHHDDAAERRHGIGGEGLVVRLLDRLCDPHAARVRVLDDHARGAVELEREQTRRREVVQVVERERLAVELLDAREQVRASAPLGVVGGALVRILAVGEVVGPVEHRHDRLGEQHLAGKPACDRAVVGRGRRERARCELPPGLERHIALPEPVQDALVVVRAADGDHVGMVLRRGAQERRAADVDLLDHLVPGDVEAGHGLLERIEVHADEIDRLNAVGGEIGDVLGNVAPGEDAAVDGRVQRDHPVAEHFGEARHVLEGGDGDALVREQLGRAAAREQLEVESVRAPARTRRFRTCRRRRAAHVSCGAQLPHDLGQQPVLDVLDPRVQGCRRVAGQDRDRLLSQHGARVDAVVDQVDRRARLGRPRRERLLDGMGAGEGGKQRRMHVHDPAREASEKHWSQKMHVSRADDEPDAERFEPVGHRRVARLAVA